jgi:hypothetical protein
MFRAIAAALAAGVISWFVGEYIVAAYRDDLNPPLKIAPSAEDVRKLKSARINSATLTFLALGGLLGFAMGLAGGLARRSPSAGIGTAVLGLVIGSAAAGSTALGAVWTFYKLHDPQSTDLVLPLFTHVAIWAIVGAVGGLFFGIGLGANGRWKPALAGGLMGAIMATVLYEIVGAIVFASSKTELPLSSSSVTRAMAQLLVTVLAALGVAVALHQSSAQEASAATAS